MAALPGLTRRKTMLFDEELQRADSMESLYEAGDVIGTGSFGIIRKVVRRADGKILARKDLNYGRMDERDLKQLTEEVNILEHLDQHDHIVRYIERFVDKANTMLYIIMEYCEGGDLTGLIRQYRKQNLYIPEDKIWSFLTQLTLALAECHSEVDSTGDRKSVILHRDLKPDNVFIGHGETLKLGDFGLSKAMAQAAMTQTYVGTPYYMSPELLTGAPYDVKCDIWALGCLTFELCAGKPPFAAATTQQELTAMVKADKIPELPKHYSPRLAQYVKAMLKQHPRHRPDTAGLMAQNEIKYEMQLLNLRKERAKLREQSLILAQREAAVLAREKVVLTREMELKSRIEAFNDAQQAFIAHQKARRASAGGDRENQRPPSAAEPGAQDDAIARVASRPSLVPRRPLGEERRSSNGGPGISFPRVSSASSLMSLDETPIKAAPQSLRRRLASKSMHNLTGGSGGSSVEGTPSRGAAPGSGYSTRSTTAGGRMSPTKQQVTKPRGSDASMATIELGMSQVGIDSQPNSPTLLAKPSPAVLASARSTSAPGTVVAPPLAPRPTPASVQSAPTIPAYVDEDDLPSPFLKKADASRFPGGPGHVGSAPMGRAASAGAVPMARKPSRVSLAGTKPTMAARLLKTQAQAQEAAAEVGKRISAATAATRARKSVQAAL